MIEKKYRKKSTTIYTTYNIDFYKIVLSGKVSIVNRLPPVFSPDVLGDGPS